MYEAIHPLPQYVMAWCLVKAQGQVYLYFTCMISSELLRSFFGGGQILKIRKICLKTLFWYLKNLCVVEMVLTKCGIRLSQYGLVSDLRCLVTS
jgi:hypothetical protein